ncbi:MAG: response regulator [Methanosarcinales archaeon]|nr:response regulator [Methanosarcinales archaeon]
MVKILIVEDDLDSMAIAKDLFESNGHECITAENGLEALEIVDAELPDIVLMDLMMPVMDGYEATRQIKEKHKDIPVIALTAKVMEGDVKVGIEAGCDGYVYKPYDTKKLLDYINAFF